MKETAFKADQRSKIVPIKPLSPLSDNDDSLTFVSLPQQEDFDCAVTDFKNTQTSSAKTSGPKGDGDQRPGSLELTETTAKRDVNFKLMEIESKSSRSQTQTPEQSAAAKLRSDLMEEFKPEKEVPVLNLRRSHLHISDVAATLPLSYDYSKTDCDMADVIADSLQKSQLMDEHPVDDLDVKSFPLANQHEELLVRLIIRLRPLNHCMLGQHHGIGLLNLRFNGLPFLTSLSLF